MILDYMQWFSFAAVHSPGDSDSRVQVVELGRAQCDLLVLVFVGQLDLELRQLILESLHRLLLLLGNSM